MTDQDGLMILYERDVLSRVLSKTYTYEGITIAQELVTYSGFNFLSEYGADGNIATTTRHINEKEAVDTFAYDSFQRITEKKDAAGHAFTTRYDEQHTNALGQRVLQTITTDPKGISTLETSDALFRMVKQETLDADKDTIACQEMTHDAAGNLLFQRDHIYEHGHYRNTQTIKYVYTQENRIASF